MKRQRRLRQPKAEMPAWAIRLRDHHELPEKHGPDWDDYMDWAYFLEPVPGLPKPDSRAAFDLKDAAGVYD